jgi:AraC-like DNA-binding protein
MASDAAFSAVPGDFRGRAAVREPSGGDPADDRAADRGRLASIVVKLLDDAGRSLGADSAAAIEYIARASALLQAERDRLEPAAGGASVFTHGGLAPWRTRRVIAHIDESLATTIRLKDLARIAQLSPSHFARAFKASFKEAPAAFVARRRVARAQELMLTTDQSLCQISLACGLCDQAHFSRLFNRVVGMSPNLWRRQWLGRRWAQRSPDGNSAAGVHSNDAAGATVAGIVPRRDQGRFEGSGM